ncbi:MAG: N-6 DNA methylase [Leptospiraceae bacterium]|nr:N-6 DNA methylase [Leptospiraceae bacterium]MCP5496297.1 N-6 DNA methylase [Leptospiraceae bacterium]
MKKKNTNKKFNQQKDLDSYIWNACDILRRSNCAGALQYVPEITWMLFLRILDIREEEELENSEAVGHHFEQSLKSPYRWRDWAATYDLEEIKQNKKADGWKRYELTEKGSRGDFITFINNKLLPYLKKLKDQPNASVRQKVISEIMTNVEKTRVDTERNLLDVLDKIHEINPSEVDNTHIFTLSQVYEGLLLKMGEKGNDGGQFFTPREVIRFIIKTIDPKPGEIIYDPCCGTGGFLAEGFNYINLKLDQESTEELENLKHNTFFGREKENLIYPIALANLILHGINEPHIWHGNTLSGEETYSGLFQNAPSGYDVIVTNPPFGGKENKDVQSNFEFKTNATQVLFLQHVIKSLKNGGRCGIVLDEGVLFRTNETAFFQTKEKLLDECKVFAIVSLPSGVFNSAGAGVKTNVLFFEKGSETDKIWYYDLSDVKVGKKSPLTQKNFEEFFQLLPKKGKSNNSWIIDFTTKKKKAKAEAEKLKKEAKKVELEIDEINSLLALNKDGDEELENRLMERTKEKRDLLKKAQNVEYGAYDLKAVNPNKKTEEDRRTPKELIEFLQIKGKEVEDILKKLSKS